MAGSVTIEWHGDEFINRVEKAADGALNATTQYAADQARLSMGAGITVPNGTAVRDIPSSPAGGPPGVRTARLRSSITNARVGKLKWAFGTNVVYARIQELGGTIQHPGGTAFLTFGGKAVFVSNANAKSWMRRTAPHPIVLPARPYLRPVINTKKKQMQGVFNAAFKRAFGGAA